MKRRAGFSVGVVYGGSGTVMLAGDVIGRRRARCRAGGVFAVPSWTSFAWTLFGVAAHERLELFGLSDAPVFEALRLDREETVDG